MFSLTFTQLPPVFFELQKLHTDQSETEKNATKLILFSSINL